MLACPLFHLSCDGASLPNLAVICKSGVCGSLTNAVLKHLQKYGNLSPISMPHLRNLFDHLIPLDDKLDTRFDEAVTLLAGMDPVFAFDLRSKNLLPQSINKMRLVATTAGEDLAKYEALESSLIETLAPKLDEAILRVAKHHSGKSYREVQAVIAQKNNVEEAMAPLLKSIGLEKMPPT